MTAVSSPGYPASFDSMHGSWWHFHIEILSRYVGDMAKRRTEPVLHKDMRGSLHTRRQGVADCLKQVVSPDPARMGGGGHTF